MQYSHAPRYADEMGVTVQVRDLDPIVSQKLRDAAAREGLSLSEFLRRELSLFVRRLEVQDKLGGPFPGLAGIDIQEIVQMTREDRDSR
jgi:hypothetical protein